MWQIGAAGLALLAPPQLDLFADRIALIGRNFIGDFISQFLGERLVGVVIVAVGDIQQVGDPGGHFFRKLFFSRSRMKFLLKTACVII